MSQIAAPSPRLREQTATALAPFFMNGADSDTDLAREAAASILDDYHPMTPKELQLSAQIVAFGFAALACLGAAATVRGQDLDVMLDLQDSAIALNTLAEKSTKALDARRRERERAPHLMSATNTDRDNAGFQAAIGRALEKLLYANSRMAALPQAASVAAAPAVTPQKLPILSAERMTLSLLSRRGSEAETTAGRRSALRTRQ
jgi:hypothetical protein